MSFLMQQQILELQQSVTLLQAQILELLAWQMEMDPPQPQDQPDAAVLVPLRRKPGRPPKVKHEETPDNAA